MSKLKSAKLFFTDRRAFRLQWAMFVNRCKVNITKFFIELMSWFRRSFLTFHARPMYAKDYQLWSDPLKKNEKVAIIIQGPIKYEHDFTLESVKLYKKSFDNTEIIVSTWENENPEYLKKIAEAGAAVVTSKTPQVSGVGNINFQIVSTVAGLKKARELGAEYVYKTRVDQRMYAAGLNEYCINLLNFFPSKEGYTQKKRIIASSFITLKYAPYVLADTWMFGQIDDMVAYWSLPLDTRTKPSKFIKTLRDLIDERICEMRLCSTYLEKIGRKLEWTITDSWRMLADHFIVIDRHMLDLFFYKYDHYREYGPYTYRGITNNQIITHADWFNMHANLHNKKIDNLEQVIDLPSRESIITERYGN